MSSESDTPRTPAEQNEKNCLEYWYLGEQKKKKSGPTTQWDFLATFHAKTTYAEAERALAGAGMRLHAPDDLRTTPLHIAVHRGAVEVARYILEKTYPVDWIARNVAGMTPYQLRDETDDDMKKLFVDHFAKYKMTLR